MDRESPEVELPSRRIARDLRDAITSGEIAPGQKLPSERELAAQYSAARNTARGAIRLLAEEGLVSAEHGRGVFVRQKQRLLQFGSERYSRQLRKETGLSPFRAEVAKQGRTARVECTSIENVPAPVDVAERLHVSADDVSVVRRENWYFADEDPVQIGVTYIPLTIAGGSVLATSANMGRGSLYARFAELGHSISRVREEITSRMPTPDEARLLHIPEGVPILHVVHTSIDQQGTPFEVTTFVMRADLTGLDYNMPVES